MQELGDGIGAQTGLASPSNHSAAMRQFVYAVLLLGSLTAASDVPHSDKYMIPGYNVEEKQAVMKTPPLPTRKLTLWKHQRSDQALAAAYKTASDYLRVTTVDGVQSTSSMPTKDRVINYVEWGSNNGEWTAKKMKEARTAGQAARCFTFEPLPRFKSEHEALVKQYNCTYHPTVVWTRERHFTFYVGSQRFGNAVTSTIFNDSVTDTTTGKITVKSVDGAAWMMQTFIPTDFIYMRMDIEGAEYSVLRNLVLRGTACWVDIMELELHALHTKSNYHKRPADVVFPWLLRGCGVDVRTEKPYDQWWRPDDTHCNKCMQLHQEMRDDDVTG